jgi:hypothetical protein
MEEADSKTVSESCVHNSSLKVSQAQDKTADARLEPMQAHDFQIGIDTSSTGETHVTSSHQMKEESQDQNGGSIVHSQRGDDEIDNGEERVVEKPSEDPTNLPLHDEEFASLASHNEVDTD